MTRENYQILNLLKYLEGKERREGTVFLPSICNAKGGDAEKFYIGSYKP
jgi:hypothetical protein